MSLGHEPLRFGSAPRPVLVTGGTGFIGRHLVRALRANGHRVSVWTRGAAAAQRRLGAEVACVQRLQDLRETPEVVINLAGARILGWPWTASRRAALLASRGGLTRKLVDWIGTQALPDGRPGLMLSGSAIGYYGVQPEGDDTALAEDAPPQPLFMSELCQRWEQAAQGVTRHGWRLVRLRLGVVLGHQGALPQMLLPIRLGLGGPLAGGRQWCSWVHVEDVLRAIAFAWTQAEARQAGELPDTVYNLTAPGAVRQADFARTAARILHRPCVLPTPGLPMRLALGEQAGLLLQGQRVVPRRLLESGFTFRFPDLPAALADLC